MKLLIAKGASVNHRDNDNGTALEVATLKGDLNQIRSF